jgi:hypothetical protein
MWGDGLATKKWGIAVVLAILMHFLLLAVPVSKESKPNQAKTKLRITFNTLQQEIELPTNTPPKKAANALAVTAEVENNPPKQNTKPLPQESPLDEEDQSRITENSLVFRRFLQAEISRDAQTNPNAAKEFSETFTPYFVAPEIAEDTEYSQGPLGGGQYKIRKNGKVYCVLKMVPLSMDDQEYGFPSSSKDCTLKQKFDPKLRINTLD